MTAKVEAQEASEPRKSRYGDPHKFDPDFKGPTDKRSCTDVLCILLFIAFLVGWVVVGVMSAVYGDPSRLLLPTDSLGQVCGRDEAVQDKPFLLFFDITRCASPKVPFTGCPTQQVCVKECPTENWFHNGPHQTNKSQLLCKYNADIEGKSINDLVSDQDCASYYVHSRSIAHRCFPRSLQNFTDSLLNNILGGSQTHRETKLDTITDGIKYMARFIKIQQIAEGVVEDIKNLWPFILLGCAMAMVISFVWICLLRLIATVMVWFSLVAFTGLSGFSAYYTLNKYLKLRKEMENKEMSETEMAFTSEFSKVAELESTWLVLFIITVTVFLVILIIIIFLRKRIRLAVALIREASKAVGSIMCSLTFPIFPYIMEIIVLLSFCVVFLLLSSSGRPEYRVVCFGDCECSPLKENATCHPAEFSAPNCQPNEVECQFFNYQKHAATTYFHIYNIFAMLWAMFFISAFEEMVLAGAFSSWYWAFKKPHDVPSYPLVSSTRRTMRFHMGTLAFGSLIIAIVRFIRLIFEYIDYKLRQYADNACVKCLLCTCRCCLWCLETFLRFINRNAYVYCAMYGTNFCTSGRKAFSLIMRNIARVVVLDKVTDFLLLIGKLVVTGFMAILSFYFFSGEIVVLRDHLPEVNYYLTPVFIITFSTFFIATSFFEVYNMAVDTLFFCFLEDCERNDGSQDKPYFMSKKLMEILHKSNKNKEE